MNVKELENKWRAEVNETLREFKKEFDVDWKRACKIRFYQGKLDAERQHGDALASSLRTQDPASIGYKVGLIWLKESNKREDKIKYTISVLTNMDTKKDDLTDEMVEFARQRFLADFVEVGRSKMIRCPFHKQGDERKPSMKINDHYAYCFTCSKSWDTIEFIKETKGLNFVEAVKFLNGA